MESGHWSSLHSSADAGLILYNARAMGEYFPLLFFLHSTSHRCFLLCFWRQMSTVQENHHTRPQADLEPAKDVHDEEIWMSDGNIIIGALDELKNERHLLNATVDCYLAVYLLFMTCSKLMALAGSCLQLHLSSTKDFLSYVSTTIQRMSSHCYGYCTTLGVLGPVI